MESMRPLNIRTCFYRFKSLDRKHFTKLYKWCFDRTLLVAQQIYLNVERGKIFLKTMDLARENKNDIARLGETIFNAHKDAKEIPHMMHDQTVSRLVAKIVDHQSRLSKMRSPS